MCSSDLVVNEYGLNRSSVSEWVKRYKNSGSFNAKDNISEEELENRRLKVQLKEKQMEIDILKKAMVIMLMN